MAIVLAGCGGGGEPGRDAPRPTLDGVTIAIPDNGVDRLGYVTQPVDSLVGVKTIRMTYRVDIKPGAHIVPASDPKAASSLTLYFQRAGDNGTAQGQYEAFRWYAAFGKHSPILAGTYSIVAPMDGNWSAVLTSTRASNPTAFRYAVEEATKVGFVLGGGDGLGHGVRATGPASITILSYELIR